MIRLRILPFYILALILCALSACKEDIVSQTLITGRVYDSATKQGYEGISVSYRTAGSSLIGGSSPFPVLLSHTDSLGNFEVLQEIDEEKSYAMLYQDTATVGTSCRYFSGRAERNVDNTLSSQKFDIPLPEDARCPG